MLSNIIVELVVAVIIALLGFALNLFGIKDWFFKKIKNNNDVPINDLKNDDLDIKNELLIKIYKKGRKGHSSVSLYNLKKHIKMSEITIINKLEKAEKQGLIKNNPTFDNQFDWILTNKGVIYVESLLE